MYTEVACREFANGIVYALKTEDGYVVEVTDTFLPYYTKDAIGTHQNALSGTDLGSRADRWMIGVSTMSGCPIRCRFCFVPGTLIYTDEFNYVNIEELAMPSTVVGNQLRKLIGPASVEYVTMYSRSSEVTEVMCRQYSGTLVVITTKNGNCIKVTPEHPIPIKRRISRKKFVAANTIRPGDRVISANPIFQRTQEWIIGWLAGFIAGDGVYTKNTNRSSYKTSVAQSNIEVLQFCHEELNNLGIVTSNIWDNGNGNSRFSFGESAKVAFDKIQESVNTSNNYKRGYLAGFWDAEGYSFKNNNTYRVCGTDLSLLNKISTYLIEFGYSARVMLYKSSKGRVGKKDCYIVESSLGWVEFCATYRPVHTKSLRFKAGHRAKSFSSMDEVISVTEEIYSGPVYNIETTANTYFANNILVHNCATGQLRKSRLLTADEIIEQIKFVLAKRPEEFRDAKEHKINYTRMGEPFLNIDAVREAISWVDYYHTGTHHYLSTIGIKNADYSWISGNVTLQVSVHSLLEDKRNCLIPYKKKATLEELGQIRTNSNLKTTVNMTLVDEEDFDINELTRLFDKKYFFIKLSPINRNCISDENGMGNGIITAVNLR